MWGCTYSLCTGIMDVLYTIVRVLWPLLSAITSNASRDLVLKHRRDDSGLTSLLLRCTKDDLATTSLARRPSEWQSTPCNSLLLLLLDFCCQSVSQHTVPPFAVNPFLTLFISLASKSLPIWVQIFRVNVWSHAIGAILKLEAQIATRHYWLSNLHRNKARFIDF